MRRHPLDAPTYSRQGKSGERFTKIQKILVYAGDLEQKTASGTWVLPLQAFLERVVAE